MRRFTPRLMVLLTLLLGASMVLAACQSGTTLPTVTVTVPTVTVTLPTDEDPGKEVTEAATEGPAAEATEAPEEPAEVATEAPEATEPAEDTGAAGQAPEDELGVVEIAPGDPIVLAYAMVVAGADATLGEDSRRGVEIALEDAGNELLGHPIELIGEDTGCNAEGGQAAATRLVANEQIVAIIGTSCSSEARVAAPVVDQAGMVLISPSNTAPDLTDPETHVPGYLRTAHNDKVQGRVVAEFAYNELGLTRAATIHDGSPYAEGLVTVFADVFTELGGEMVSEEAVGPEDTDMRPVLTRVAAQEPELIYYPIFIQAGGFVTRQAREVEGLEEVVLIGSDGLFSPEFLNAAGDAVEGMYLSSPDFSAFQEGYEEFLAKHEERYGEATLSAFHAHAYDATNMILAAIEEVAVEGEDGTLWIGRQALRDALYATEGFQGLTGNLTCDENGDCADPVIAVYEVVDADPDAWTGGTGDNPNPQKVYPEAGAAEGEGEAEETPEAEAEETPEADAGGEAATGDTIVMSFVPSGDTQEIIASGEEIAAMIEDITGLDIEANVATSYAAVVEAMCAGNAGVGWLNTFSYILANERCGVDVSLATVRRGEPFYTGQIIANADSGIESLEDLDGKVMCWVDPLSTSGYIIPRVMIAAAGVDPDTGFADTVEAGSHPNVVTAVYNGECDAGATFVDARTAIQEEFPDVMERVIVVAESPPIPNDTVAFAEDLDSEARQQIVDALLEIAETEEGQAALAEVYEIEGFEEVDDTFYDAFRAELDASGIDIEELAGD